MSETGLFSGTYDQIRQYAVMLDDVLIRMKEGTSSPDDPQRQNVGKLLIKLAGPNYDDPSNRLAVLILHETVGLPAAEMLRAGETLLGGVVSDQHIETLERFAQGLEQEQARAMARIEGQPE